MKKILANLSALIKVLAKILNLWIWVVALLTSVAFWYTITYGNPLSDLSIEQREDFLCCFLFATLVLVAAILLFDTVLLKFSSYCPERSYWDALEKSKQCKKS